MFKILGFHKSMLIIHSKFCNFYYFYEIYSYLQYNYSHITVYNIPDNNTVYIAPYQHQP